MGVRGGGRRFMDIIIIYMIEKYDMDVCQMLYFGMEAFVTNLRNNIITLIRV